VSFLARWGIESATPNPTLEFYGFSQALDGLLRERNSHVDDGYYACEGGCDPNSPSIRILNTVQLDSDVKSVFKKTVDASVQTGIDPTALPKVQTYFGTQYIDYATDAACTSGRCSFNDVTFVPGASDRMLKWSPKANDPVNVRWGFSAPPKPD
jgi:hypothetical protein